MEFIDSHCHLDARAFDEDREQVLEKIFSSGIRYLINIGATDGLQGAHRSLALAEKYERIFCSVGIHPHDSAKNCSLDELKQLSLHPKVLAIGETGLDYHYDFSSKEEQEKAFRAQIELALLRKLPVIIHCREAGNQCLAIVREYAKELSERGGVFHCYAESAEFAQSLRELNFLVSYTGILSFPKATALREAAKNIPLDMIMLETDAPYLAPVPFRGKRCDSSMLPHTAEALSVLLDKSLAEIAEITTNNALRFFRLPLC